MARPKADRVSKRDWLEQGLQILEREGVAGVRVEVMARALDVAKSGFYWHFADREDLLDHMLDYWSEEYTGVVTTDIDVSRASPEERLRRTAQMILDRNLGRYDVAMRAWAAHDARVGRRVREVWSDRLEFVGQAFAELGFEGDDLEMRTRLFTCYHTWERAMYWKEPKAKLRRLIDRRLALLLER